MLVLLQGIVAFHLGREREASLLLKKAGNKRKLTRVVPDIRPFLISGNRPDIRLETWFELKTENKWDYKTKLEKLLKKCQPFNYWAGYPANSVSGATLDYAYAALKYN